MAADISPTMSYQALLTKTVYFPARIYDENVWLRITQAQAEKACGWAVEPLGNWICIVGCLTKVGHIALFVEAVARRIQSVQAAIRPEADHMREKGAKASH